MLLMNEFELIRHYFQRHAIQRDDVIVGIGDDAAILRCPSKQQLVSTMDTMVDDVHFNHLITPLAVGHKLATVNLSDIAAMGAVPAWASLSLSMPDFQASWLEDFSQGFMRTLCEHGVALIGGDSVRGPLSVTCQLTGFVPEGEALTRAGAQVGDIIVVSGTLGDAGRALQLQQQGQPVSDYWCDALQYPTARVALGQALRGMATAAIDISDGLLADCQHILTASGVGAVIDIEKVPLSESMCTEVDAATGRQLALTAGDDYELCFCIPEDKLPVLSECSTRFDVPLTPIGRITAEPSLRVVDAYGCAVTVEQQGYRHF